MKQMGTQRIDTLIVGAGVAGIGCARRLHEANRDFLIISEDVGGRIKTSPDGTINYGAYLVLGDYNHILPFVTKGQRLHPFKIEYHGKRKRPYYMSGAMLQPIQLVRAKRLLRKFVQQEHAFRTQCEVRSQKEALEDFPWLYALYHQPANEFIKHCGFTHLAERYFAEGVYMCCFLPMHRLSAFDFLRAISSLIVHAYEFILHKELLLTGISDRIEINTVTNVERTTDHYLVTTAGGIQYTANHLVIAVPPHRAKTLIDMEPIKEPASAHVFHVKGTIKPTWHGGEYELFCERSHTIFFRQQHDGTYIFYSHDAEPNLHEFFEDPIVLMRYEWKPAFNISGDTLIETDLGNDLYLAGDYNLGGLEDSYISGLYAANQIIASHSSATHY